MAGCPRASAWFKNHSGFDEMDTVNNPSAHTDYQTTTPFITQIAITVTAQLSSLNWPVHVFTDAPSPVKVAPVVTGQKCHRLHNAAIHECFDCLSPPVPLSNSPLAMLFSGQLERQEAIVLLEPAPTS